MTKKTKKKIDDGKSFKLVAANGTTYLSTVPGTYGGHLRLKIYGKLDCPSAVRWLKKGHYKSYRVFFANRSDAQSAGYRPCKICCREEYAEAGRTV